MARPWLADAVLVVHVLFVLFVVGGFVLILAGAGRWSWIGNRTFRVSHVAAIVFVAVEALLGFTCPLTLWEDMGAVPYAARVRCERALVTGDQAELDAGLAVLERLGDRLQVGRYERCQVG